MRLIDADALTEQMHNHYEVRNPKQNATMDECCTMVFHAQTIDAVPVVRCKDCKYIENIEGNYPYCSYHNSECAYNNFCSYGERKDGDG